VPSDHGRFSVRRIARPRPTRRCAPCTAATCGCWSDTPGCALLRPTATTRSSLASGEHDAEAADAAAEFLSTYRRARYRRGEGSVEAVSAALKALRARL
jgi:hypothetical protein